MQSTHIHAVPKQSVEVYKVLSASSNDLTARQIAKQLSITPNTVYRATAPLIELGMVEEMPNRPMTYHVSSPAIAEKLFSRMALVSFRKEFGIANTKKIDDTLPSITFIKDRKSLRIITEQEAHKAKKSISFITSGHRVAESTILIYRKAALRNVHLRVIIENDPKGYNVDLEAYKIMQVEARHLANLGMRLFIFDKKTAVLTSYNSRIPSRAFGIRFVYEPVAKQLEQLFEQRWEQSTPIDL
jgi:sugar-specific transcriptional regulator TrmB